MKLATWNVNGVRARLDRAVGWLERHAPDVVCLQEIKCEDDKFPHAPFEALGYRVVTCGQKGFHGVAIVARGELSDVERGFGDGVEDAQARVVSATFAGVRVVSVYVPNGEAVGTDKYAYKLRWLERLRAWVAPRLASGPPLAIGGDYNVAPADLDVHDPAAWAGKVLCSEAERTALARVVDLGLVDVLRAQHPGEALYTWWDYRMLGFPKNLGMRIDHVLASPALAARVTAAWVDRDERKGALPSDHAPVFVELADG